MSRKDAKSRIKSQLPLDRKIEAGDFVVNNDGTLGETKRQVGTIYSLLTKRESE
jgi:dephospho-CoA kinase